VLQPYQMVKKLRTGVETGNTGAVLDDDVDRFLAAALGGGSRGPTRSRPTPDIRTRQEPLTPPSPRERRERGEGGARVSGGRVRGQLATGPEPS